MIRVKVCGLLNPLNVRDIAGIKPDFMGFIFYPGSVRYVGTQPDPSLFESVPSGIPRVGVFINEENKRILEITKRTGIGFVQLHGNETVQDCGTLRSTGLKIIKAFNIDNEFEFESVKLYLPYCDYLLFDTKSEKQGGSGKKFNWEKLGEYRYGKQFFLSGGIGPDDTEFPDYLMERGLFCLDINSRFETEPGIKDVSLTEKFIKTIQNYQL
jgi:phosphoribosylanthranilate isomerase